MILIAAFKDRIEASKLLTERLLSALNEHQKNNFDSNSILVLAIPRGGAVIGDVIASRIGAKLDLVITRKIGAPFNPELAIGAIMPDGTYFLDAHTVEALGIPMEYISAETSRQMSEINRRLILYRGRRGYDNEIEGKIVILVDDGVATGSTIYAAAKWIKNQRCKKLIIAVPVGPRHTLEKLREVADMVVYVYAPDSFEGVGQFYEDFHQVTDEEVVDIMRKHGYKNYYGQSKNAVA